jgi:hypothetical protein
MAAYPLRFKIVWSILPAGEKDKEREKGIPNSPKEGMENS